MPRWTSTYVRVVEAVNYRVGRAAMYLIFVLMAILLWSSFSKIMFELGTEDSVLNTTGLHWLHGLITSMQIRPTLWTVEMAQFVMVAYYLLGGPYSMQLNSHVRMDLLYGSWSDRTKAWVDAFTIFFLIFYLGVLLYGGINSTWYAFDYNIRNSSAWRPYIWPVRAVSCVGIFLMILQAIAVFFKDLGKLKGEEI